MALPGEEEAAAAASLSAARSLVRMRVKPRMEKLMVPVTSRLWAIRRPAAGAGHSFGGSFGRPPAWRGRAADPGKSPTRRRRGTRRRPPSFPGAVSSGRPSRAARVGPCSPVTVRSSATSAGSVRQRAGTGRRARRPRRGHVRSLEPVHAAGDTATVGGFARLVWNRGCTGRSRPWPPACPGLA